MSPLKSACFASFLFVVAGVAQDGMTKESMAAGVRANLAAFSSVTLPPDGGPVEFKTSLGESTSSVKETEVFDGLRFMTPEKLEGRDFIWYFNSPKHWGNWFIIPAEGDFEGGFQGWLNGDKAYRALDNPGETNRLRVLQSLDHGYFQPGKEYILWFRKVGEGKPSELRGSLALVSRPADAPEWNHAAIEQALKLKPAPATDQAKELGSRGANILLDPAFFEPAEAEERINQTFFDIRQTRRLRGGYFVTMEISCPPCRRKPSMGAIRNAHGEPDFIVTSEEVARVSKHAGGARPEQEGKVVTHYYDYFGFEVAANDPKGTVLRVTTHANDFSAVRAPDEAPHFGSVPMKNLTVFQENRKEVGRMYFFLEAGKEPLPIQVPPAGKYRSGDEVLEHQGEGRWLWQTLRKGKIARSIPFENHRMNGRAEGFFDNGKPSFIATYKDGVLNGEVIEYSNDGSVARKQMFRNGKPDSASAAGRANPK